MNWFYAENNERRGPVDAAAFDTLVRSGGIKAEMLVWHEGMAEWKPFGEVAYQRPAAAAPAPSTAVAPGTEMGMCAESGRILPRSELVEIDGRLVSAEYKNVVLQRIREGVSGSGAAADPEALAQEIIRRDYHIGIGSCIGRAWALVKSHFWLTVGATVLAYLVLIAAAMIPLAGLLVQGPLIGGIYWFMLRLLRGEPAVVGDAFQGFSRGWGQLVATSLVSSLLIVPAVLPGIILLAIAMGASSHGEPNIPLLATGGLLMFAGVLAAIYFTIAWIFALALVIDKGLDFWPAMKLSRRVVGLHWWQIFGLMLTTGLLLAGVLMVGILATGLIGGAAAFGMGKGSPDPGAMMAIVLPIMVLDGLLFLALLPVAFGTLMVAYEDIFGARRDS